MAYPPHQFPKIKLCIGFLDGQPTRYMLVYNGFYRGIFNLDICSLDYKVVIRKISVINIEPIPDTQIPKALKKFFDSAKRVKPLNPSNIDMKLARYPGDATIFKQALNLTLSTYEVLYFAFAPYSVQEICEAYNYQANQFKSAAQIQAAAKETGNYDLTQYQYSDRPSPAVQLKNKQEAVQNVKSDYPPHYSEPPKTAASKIWCVSYNAKPPTREVITGFEKRGGVTVMRFSSGNKCEVQKATFDAAKMDPKLEKRISYYYKRGHKELAKMMRKNNLASEKQVCLPDSYQFEDVHAAIFEKLIVFDSGKQILVYGFRQYDAQQILAFVNKPPAKDSTDQQHYAVQATSLDQYIKCMSFDAAGYNYCVVYLIGGASDKLRFQLKPLCAGDFEDIDVDEIEQGFVGNVNYLVKQCYNQLNAQIIPITLVNYSRTVAYLAFFDESWVKLCYTELIRLQASQYAAYHISSAGSDGDTLHDPSAEVPQVYDLISSAKTDLPDKETDKAPSLPTKQKKQTIVDSHGQLIPNYAKYPDKRSWHAENTTSRNSQYMPTERSQTRPSEQIVATLVTPSLASANMCLVKTEFDIVRGYFKVVAIDGKKILLIKTCFQKFYQTVDVRSISVAEPTLYLVNQYNQQRLAFKQLIEREEAVYLDPREYIGAFDLYIFKEGLEVRNHNDYLLLVFVEERLVNDFLESFY